MSSVHLLATALFCGSYLARSQAKTGNSFVFDTCEAFTFSSGIYEFNNFIGAVSGSVSIRAVYAIDPVHSIVPAAPAGARRKQYASGTAGRLVAGFEHLPLARWRNEDEFASHSRIGNFEYLHNRCMPLYVLHLGLTTP